MLETDELFAIPAVSVALTFAVYYGASLLRRRWGYALLNPVLVSVTAIILLLLAADVDYSTYNQGGSLITFWLQPAVVALGVPLYRQLETIRRQMLPVLLAEISGCVAGIVSVVLVAQAFDASAEVIMSLVPKAVTTPIAMEVSDKLGGITSLTAAVVVCTGIFGSVAGFKMVSMGRIKSPIAGSLSVGTATHAIGTAAAMERGERYGAFSSLGLTINGLLTALLSPLILDLLGY